MSCCLQQGSTVISYFWEPPQTSRLQKGDESNSILKTHNCQAPSYKIKSSRFYAPLVLSWVLFFGGGGEGWGNGLLLCNVSFHCRVHSIQLLGPYLSRWTIPSTPRPSTRSLSVRFNNKNYVCISLFPYVRCVSCESYHWLFNHLGNIRRRAVSLAAGYVTSLRVLSFCFK